MEDFLLLLLLIAVVWLIIRQSSLAQAAKNSEDLGKQISRLETRITLLEKSPWITTPEPTPQPAPESPIAATVVPHYATFTATKTTPPAVPPSTPVKLPPPAPQPVVPPPQTIISQQITPPPPQRSISLEERLGQNWLNKLGIVTLVMGVALFLGYQAHNLGPLGKSLIGLTLSLAILTGGLVLERRDTYRLFARAMIGGGWALTFFVTFALYHVPAMQVLQSQTPDLVLMFIVCAAMVAHSLRYKSQVVTSLAFLLAFATVGISEVTLFSLVAGAILAVGLIYVAARQSWFALALCGIIGVYLNHFLWLRKVLPDGATPGHPFPDFIASAALLLTYWLLFRLLYIFRPPPNHREQVIASLTAVLNSVGLMSLLKYQSSHPEWAFYGLIALGLAELTLAFIARPRFRIAFIVLTCIASSLLLAAIPFRFAGNSWTLLWLLESEMLFITGIAIKESVFRRLGTLAGFGAAAVLFVTGTFPIGVLREQQTDTSSHITVAITLFTAAFIFWFNAEFASRRWKFITIDSLDVHLLTITTYAAALFAAAGLWVAIPNAWTAITWLALTLILGLIADRLSSSNLATQADLIAFAAILRFTCINFELPSTANHLSLRTFTIVLAAALLYLNMGRKTCIAIIPVNYIPAAYSWAAAAILSALAWHELQSFTVAVAWGVFAIILFELGLNLRRPYFRYQAYALLFASFLRIWFSNLAFIDCEPAHVSTVRLYTVIPLITAYLWIYHRLTAQPDSSPAERTVATAAAWAGLISTAALIFIQVRTEYIAIYWAALATLCLAAAWTLRRGLFTLQAITTLIATAIASAAFNLLNDTTWAAHPTTSRLYCVSLTCAILFAALPIAFQLRKQSATVPNISNNRPAWRAVIFHRPEQPFFFIPLTLLTILLAVELRAGRITIGWSALGVIVFLFALVVKERSYRLAGLCLLLLGVAKILTIDIWAATPVDRYITLIVMGAALLLVSFLYSQYRDTLLKFL